MCEMNSSFFHSTGKSAYKMYSYEIVRVETVAMSATVTAAIEATASTLLNKQIHASKMKSTKNSLSERISTFMNCAGA